MRRIEPISEREMVALFLRTEIQSERFGGEILSLLARDNRDRAVVDNPDCADTEENAYRSQLLGDFRGYGQQRELFVDYPKAVAWYRAILRKEELTRVRYIDYSYWNELSNGSRLPEQAAQNIRACVTVFDVPHDRFWSAAEAIREGMTFPELILVGTSPDSLVLLEGHLRLTAYMLSWEFLPDELTILMGLSSGFRVWG